MKLRTATLAAALVTAAIPSLPTSAHAFGFHGGWGWGWGGVGVGLATGALIGTALAAPYYGGYAYDYGYPAYGPAYAAYGSPAYAYDEGPAYAYDDDYGYAPSYSYSSYAYLPSYGYAIDAVSPGTLRHYAYRGSGYRHYAAYPAHRGVRAAYASYQPGTVRAAHVGSTYRAHVRNR
jgi:hypothetical protein